MRILNDTDYKLGEVISIILSDPSSIKISPQSIDLSTDTGGEVMTVNPLKSVLLSTNERVEYLPNQCGLYTLRSTMARRGFMLSHPGWVEGGYKGTLTFRILNISEEPIDIQPNERIIQLITFHLDENPEIGYNGVYQNSQGVVGDKYK